MPADGKPTQKGHHVAYSRARLRAQGQARGRVGMGGERALETRYGALFGFREGREQGQEGLAGP